MIKIIKNTTAFDIEVIDVGFTIAANYSFQIYHTEFAIWAQSSNVLTYINNGSFVINDGFNDLTAAKGIIYLQEANAQYLDKIKIDTTGISDQKKMVYNLATNTYKFIEDNPISSGIINYYINAVDIFNTTSTTYVVISGVSVTPAAGIYAIWGNFSAYTSAANRIIDLALFKNGVIISSSLRHTLASAASQEVIQSTQTVTQFNGSESCDLRVKISGNTLSVSERSLILIRLG